MKKQKYIFYCQDSEETIKLEKDLHQDYIFEIWKPKLYKIAPKGSNKKFFLLCFFWWFLHYFGLFSNYNYSIFVIYHRRSFKLAHYSVALPKNIRSPFMGKNDLQIGPIRTFENHLRKGLATFAIQKIIDFYKKKVSRFWYVVREENIPSRNCIENFGFKICGEGFKTGLFHKFILKKKY